MVVSRMGIDGTDCRFSALEKMLFSLLLAGRCKESLIFRLGSVYSLSWSTASLTTDPALLVFLIDDLKDGFALELR